MSANSKEVCLTCRASPACVAGALYVFRCPSCGETSVRLHGRTTLEIGKKPKGCKLIRLKKGRQKDWPAECSLCSLERQKIKRGYHERGMSGVRS